jgi:hypothetical protein
MLFRWPDDLHTRARLKHASFTKQSPSKPSVSQAALTPAVTVWCAATCQAGRPAAGAVSVFAYAPRPPPPLSSPPSHPRTIHVPQCPPTSAVRCRSPSKGVSRATSASATAALGMSSRRRLVAESSASLVRAWRCNR